MKKIVALILASMVILSMLLADFAAAAPAGSAAIIAPIGAPLR